MNSIKIAGVGKDADVVTNENGGKQSKAVAALHLIDPTFLNDTFGNDDDVIRNITEFMRGGDEEYLLQAFFSVYEQTAPRCENYYEALLQVGRVLQEGATKYRVNNWRLIPQEEHINHALIHYFAYLMGDTQDDHIGHCLCRLMMAYATCSSSYFSYTEFIAEDEYGI